ncbi:MAG: hypothetical protein JW839_07465 [Candidatus Lokiarchaeota archaeon]|nr:hypothetical protein [Candidatus Lokiarchaeota archaeon]
MPAQNELVIIIIGHKQSPFIKYIIDRDDIPVTWICSNVLDFQLYHADPAKASTYHLEFTNLLEQKARNYIESLAIFETLGKFLDINNPLSISTLNYLITKYITSINPSLNDLSETWKETVRAFFGDDSILPLFEDGRVIYVKVGGVEVPVRQYIVMEEAERKRRADSPGKPKKGSEKEEGQEEGVTAIIDIEDIDKFKLCGEAIKRIEQSRGVLIIPTDLISFHILAQCEEFTEALKEPESKVALISPFWPDGPISTTELEILGRSGIEPTLTALASELKEFADAIIIDERDSGLIPQLRETGMTVLVENMDPAAQASEQFLERALKTISIDLEAIKEERTPEAVPLGEKIISILSDRLTPKDAKEGEPGLEGTPRPPTAPVTTIDAPTAPAHAGGTQPAKPASAPPAAAAPAPATTNVQAAPPEARPASSSPASDATATNPPSAASPASGPSTAGQQANGDGVGPGKATGTTEIKQAPAQAPTSDEAAIDEAAPSLLGDIDKVILPRYEASIELIFSSLLSIVDKPRLVPMIYKILVKKLAKLDELNPEARTIDIITYLAAHNPDAYSELFSELLSDAIKEEDGERFEDLLHMVSLIMSASQAKRQEVIRNFIKENMATGSEFAVERTRKILNYFINKDPLFGVIICKTLIEFMVAEMEDPKSGANTINNLAFFLLSVDAVLLGETIVTDMPEALQVKAKGILEAVSCGQSFNNIVINIINAYQTGEYEALRKALNVKRVPASIQMAVLKRKYASQLLKAGSVPLDIFAEKLGMPSSEAEKLIYDMILKDDIAARMEVVGGKLYIVHDEKKSKDAGKGQERAA